MKTQIEDQQDFWKQVYVAILSAYIRDNEGNAHSKAKKEADAAVRKYQEYQHSQEK